VLEKTMRRGKWERSRPSVGVGRGGQKKRKRTSTCVIDGIGGRGYKTGMDLVDLEARSTFLAD
jgi:hypothetical protein